MERMKGMQMASGIHCVQAISVEPAKESVADASFNRLEQSQGELSDLLSRLEGRLNPVLFTATDTNPCEPANPMPMRSQIVSRIDRAQDRTEAMISRVQYFINALEI